MTMASRVLVSGAAGFVGANMVRRLLFEGAEVCALVRAHSDLWRLADVVSQLRLVECDILDAAGVDRIVAQTRPEIVYHFAFPSGYPSAPVERINMLSAGLLGTYALLNAARENSVDTFIHIGSSTEYGLSEQAHRETDRLIPSNIRGVSKAASTLLCQQFAREFDLKAVVLRLFNVYGFWEETRRFIPKACRAILKNCSLPLTLPGVMHDWIFVDDVINACVAAAGRNSAPGEIINVGSGEQHANEDVVRILGDIAGQELKVETGSYPISSHDTGCWLADINNAKDILGWKPKYSFRSGLEATLQFWTDWYANHEMGTE